MAHKQDREDSELENRTLEITQCEKQWENRLKKKKNRASEICGTVTKGLTFVISEYQKRKREGLKKSSRNNGWKFPKFSERHKHTDLRS